MALIFTCMLHIHILENDARVILHLQALQHLLFLLLQLFLSGMNSYYIESWTKSNGTTGEKFLSLLPKARLIGDDIVDRSSQRGVRSLCWLTITMIFLCFFILLYLWSVGMCIDDKVKLIKKNSPE